MFEDRKAIVKVHDHHAIDIFVEHEVYDALVKMGRANNDGISFRSKRLYPNEG